MKINDELFDYFKQAGTIKHYQKNDIIYMQDDHADELCLVLKGRVRVYHITKNGDEINYDVLDKGRIFGESSLYENAIAQQPFRLLMMLKLLLVILKIFILIYHLHLI